MLMRQVFQARVKCSGRLETLSVLSVLLGTSCVTLQIIFTSLGPKFLFWGRNTSTLCIKVLPDEEPRERVVKNLSKVPLFLLHQLGHGVNVPSTEPLPVPQHMRK